MEKDVRTYPHVGFKSNYELLFNYSEPPLVSPIGDRSLEVFHSENLKYARKLAPRKVKDKILAKYNEFNEFLVSDKNPFKEQAIILENIIEGVDSVDNYSGLELLKLYKYFRNYYLHQASYRVKDIDLLRNLFSKIDIKEDFKGVYLIEEKSELKRCLNDVLNGNYVLSNEDIKYIESIYETLDETVKRLVKTVLSVNYNLCKSNLNDDELKNEFIKFYNFIIDEDFFSEFQRVPNIVDMYLVTNLQIDDFSRLNSLGLPRNIMLTLIDWFKGVYTSIYVMTPNKQQYIVPKNIIFDMHKPPLHIIDSIVSGNYGNFKILDHNEQDLVRTRHVLLDLNSRYGVKLDHYTFLTILYSVIWGEDYKYYRLGDEYKENLDQVSHIVVSSNPVFTRRERNDA